ncbi:MAG: ATP-binding protein [Lysinibacillus sp.]
MERFIKITTSPNSFLVMILIALLTAVGGEVKFIPFEEEPFRFGLGSIIFFLAAIVRPASILKTGAVTAITVFLFRLSLDFFIYDAFSFIEHVPAALFYITFAGLLSIARLDRFRTNPVKLGFYGALLEMIANTVEQLAIALLITGHVVSLGDYLLLTTVAVLRSYFVAGLFSALALSEEKKRTEQLLSIGADLYVETLYLQKSMEQIEKITANGFDLYKQLKEIDSPLCLKALMLSQEIHEIKKDSERIYAGLSKIITAERADSYTLSYLLQLIIEANMHYSEFLHKDIQFEAAFQEDFDTKEHILLLAMLNNIISNAIEAIEEEGFIRLAVETNGEATVFTIENNGPCIPDYVLPVIFDPGYTTKFSETGNPSTGIGLSHVQTIVQRLEGAMEVSSADTTIFVITIPTYKLR